MIVVALLVLVTVLTAAGIGLLAAMLRRDEPLLGTAGLAALLAAGVVGAVYGVLAST